MPNHVTSVIVVTGQESDVAVFANAHFKEMGEGHRFDFETIIPRPESVAKTVSCNVLTPQQQADQDAALAETGFCDWYYWALHNWGTKWNSYRGRILERAEGRLKFRFQTAWSFPEPIFDALLARYPSLLFDCMCFDEGHNFAGKGRYGVDFECNSELVSDALYQEVYGRARERYEDEAIGDGEEMISAAQLILDRIDAGASVLDDFERLPAWQMRLRWDDLAPHCPSSIQPELARRPANALNVEIGEPRKRCGLLSPDGRGMRWLLSGGDALAYGQCAKRGCPRAQREEMSNG